MDGAWRRPPNHWRITGTPSLSEVPSGGARAFCLLLRFSKVSRCQSGTLSGRYRRNGYVHGPTVLTVRPSSQASQLPPWIAGHQLYLCRLPGRHGSKLPRHGFAVIPKLCRYLCSSQASQLPHFELRMHSNVGAGLPAMAPARALLILARESSPTYPATAPLAAAATRPCHPDRKSPASPTAPVHPSASYWHQAWPRPRPGSFPAP